MRGSGRIGGFDHDLVMELGRCFPVIGIAFIIIVIVGEINCVSAMSSALFQHQDHHLHHYDQHCECESVAFQL